jgi:hypothetical protein
MSEELKKLLECPAALTESEVSRLRAMVSEASRVMQRIDSEDELIRRLKAATPILFRTADGLECLDGNRREEFVQPLVIIRRPVRRMRLAVTRVSEVPLVAETIEVREYMFKEFIGGRGNPRTAVYEEVVR